MKFALFTVALSIMVSVDAIPAPPITLPTDDPDYFQAKLKSVQGAIKDTLRAGQDLQTMESKLQAIVAASSYFYRAESATEYATDRNAYANEWNSGKSNSNEKKDLGKSCTENEECASNHCLKSVLNGESVCRWGKGNIGDSCEYGQACISRTCEITGNIGKCT